MNITKGKHLTFDERVNIQEGLVRGVSFKDIAKSIERDPTTISKEVKKHIYIHTNSFVNCDDCCSLLLRAPYVCNGCKYRSRSSCHFPRHLYDAKRAQLEYETLRSESREGIPLNKESFYKTERIISNAVNNGQHIYHAIHANNLPVSTATVYRHINKGYYSISKIDLPRAVKFKPRLSHKCKYVSSSLRKGRSYAEFQEYCIDNNISAYVELDTVIGLIGGKTIMTMHFTSFNFMFGLLLENKTAAEVAHKIQELKQRLVNNGFSFSEIMPVILTDNGREFSCVKAIEDDLGGGKSKLFFCDPNMPSEKGRIEKNHTLFRDIVPKGSSFENFTQETVNKIFSHVNAVKRKNFNGKSAYDMFCFSYSKELAEVLGIKYIPAKEVCQNGTLLKK